jgi:nucleoside-diphosphate-sugar epimerase
MKKNKILISGINGFLGSHLAKHLKSSFEVIGLEVFLNNLFRIDSENFKVYSTRNSSLESIFEDNNFFAVIHAATVYQTKNDPVSNLLDANINLPIRLLELCNIYSVSLFLNTDSFFNNETYSYSYLPEYTLSKKQSLEWIKLLANNSFCKVANMKIFHMYGENDAGKKFIPFIINEIKSDITEIELTPGEQIRDFIYVKDVIRAYETVLKSEVNLNSYQQFEVGSGKSYSIKNLLKLIKKITGSKTDLKFGALDYRDGEIMNSMSNNSELVKLGWIPEFNLSEGLSKVINTFNK